MFPTSYRYTWRSAHVGDDTVVVDYTAPHYCSGCYYVVGVYGYRCARRERWHQYGTFKPYPDP